MSKSAEIPKNWTIETYAAYADALRASDRRFNDERDRRYTEVNIEKEKALKIKETADLAALSLARESQTYKEQQNDALRDKNLSESGVYATTASVNSAIEKLEAGVSKSFDALLAKLEPFMNGSLRQEGQQTGSMLTRGQILAYVSGAAGVLGALYTVIRLIHP